MFHIDSGWAGGLDRVLLEDQALRGGRLDAAEPLAEPSPLLTPASYASSLTVDLWLRNFPKSDTPFLFSAAKDAAA